MWFGVFFNQAPCLTPEWNRTSHAQTVFYTEQRCIQLQGLSSPSPDSKRVCRKSPTGFTERLCSLYLTGLNSELEELMVEGLLLQVSLPQVHSLYHILLDRANSQHAYRPASPTEEEPSDHAKHMQFISQGTNMALKQVRHSFCSRTNELSVATISTFCYFNKYTSLNIKTDPRELFYYRSTDKTLYYL